MIWSQVIVLKNRKTRNPSSFSLNINGGGNEGIVFIGIDRKKRQALAMIRASSGEDWTSFIIVRIPLLRIPLPHVPH
ncbi:hypothetical protein NSQ61_12870 [Aeribacillus sp. FSL K6-1121]|uniref:hypothetical protein n=1 Tax=unclassified Aeribacillus TaxID=2640495 RepID=UPI0030D24663